MEKANFSPNPFLYQEDTIDFRKYIFLFLSNWYWFVLTILIALGFAYYKNRYSPIFFQAAATIILEDGEGQQDVLMQFRSIRYLRKQMELQNETAKLLSYRLARRTINRLDFDVAYTAYGRIVERKMYHDAAIRIQFDTAHKQWIGKEVFITELSPSEYRLEIDQGYNVNKVMQYGEEYVDSNFKFTVFREKSRHKKYSFQILDRNVLANQYRKKLTVDADERETGTVITLKVKDENPEQAVTYLNTLCAEYINYGLERKNQIADNTIRFIDEQINQIIDSLRRTERAMLSFQLNKGVIDLTRQGEIAFDRLKMYHQQKTELIFKQKYLLYLQEYIRDRKDPQTVITPSIVNISDQLLISLINQMAELYAEKDDISHTARKDNPSLELINSRISGLRNQLLESINSNLKNTKISISQVDEELSAITSEIRELPINEQEKLNIERKYDINNKFYTFLLEKRAEAGIQKSSNIADSRILDEARLDNIQPISTNKSLNLLIALFIGLFIPAMILLLIDYFNNRITTREDIDKNTSIPVIGTLGHDYSGAELPVHDNPKSPFTESFRRIRTNLQYILHGNDQKIIMITSTISGEGKTYITVNLASIIAMSNKKVLLVGMDLRRPKLHRIFNVGNHAGISTFLIGNNSFDEIIVPLNVPNLFLAPAGPVPPNPAELLETDKLLEFLETAKKKFDYIIIDTPPVALVTDALLIGEHCDASIFIVRQKYTHKDVFDMINMLYTQKKLKNLNLLINDIKVSQAMGYKYYYGYGYSYGYGYGYSYQYKYSYDYFNTEKELSFLDKAKRWFRSEG